MARLAEDPGNRIVCRSSWYLTEPVGLEDPEWFLNGVFLLETNQTAAALLARFHEIEKGLGRQRLGKWAPRTIDLDLLFYDDRIIQEPDLIVPHPELARRRFVLDPLAEIAPDLVHPVLQRTILELNRSLGGEGQEVKKMV